MGKPEEINYKEAKASEKKKGKKVKYGITKAKNVFSGREWLIVSSGEWLGVREVTLAFGNMEMTGDFDKRCLDSMERIEAWVELSLEENESWKYEDVNKGKYRLYLSQGPDNQAQPDHFFPAAFSANLQIF